MAQFVKLENGNFLNVSCIKLIRPHAGIKYDSEKIKVDAAIIVEGSEFGGDLIAVTGVASWEDTGNEEEAYELFCTERKRLEKTICGFFPEIARGILVDSMAYYPPNWIREQLQKAATGTAGRLAMEVQKMEEEQNE